MRKFRAIFAALPLILALGGAACSDDDDITGANQSLARASVDAPDSARSGEGFDVRVTAENVGVSNIQNGRVDISLPSPLNVVSVDASAGTIATFSNGLSGGRVTWDLRTLDSNTQSTLTIRALGVLAPPQMATQLTIEANMTGEGIAAGELVARDTMTLNP